jgi:hypothetical protein
MQNRIDSRSQRRSGAVLGVLLVVAGLLYLVQQYVPFNVGEYGWPLLVVFGGLALLIGGIAVRSASGLIVVGSMATVVGLILAVQNTFGLWASWSYAWALVAPGAVGLGVAIRGLVIGSSQEVERGGWLALVGVSLFVVFALFFEGSLRINGFDLGSAGNVVLPLVLIGIGVAFLARAISRSGKGPGQTIKQ